MDTADTLGPRVREQWTHAPDALYLNHGGWGSCPRPVLEVQREFQARLERQPAQFFRDLEGLQDEARAPLAEFMGADPRDVVFVPNATTGVSCVVRSLRFAPGDELLTTTHSYNSCRNALAATEAQGTRVVTVPLPFPLASESELIEPILAAVTPRTRLAMLDWITSPTGLVLPIAKLVSALKERGVETLIDGAHAIGQVPIDLDRVGAGYFTGNCHKWLCTPKGSAALWVRRDLQDGIHPWYVGHGANSTRVDRSRFLLEFDLPPTDDPSAYLCIPAALKFLSGLLPGGIPALQARNRALALQARALLCAALRIPPPAPDDMIGHLAAVPLPEGPAGTLAPPHPRSNFVDPLQSALLSRHQIEAPVLRAAGRRILRVSAQAYNSLDQYETLARVLPGMLAEEHA